MKISDLYETTLPLTDTCSVESMAFITDQTPQEVWDQGKQFWRDGGRLRSGVSSAGMNQWLRAMGWNAKARYDLLFLKTKDESGFTELKTMTLRRFMEMMNGQPGRYLIHVRGHVIGYKDGEILDTDDTSPKVKVVGVTEVTK